MEKGQGRGSPPGPPSTSSSPLSVAGALSTKQAETGHSLPGRQQPGAFLPIAGPRKLSREQADASLECTCQRQKAGPLMPQSCRTPPPSSPQWTPLSRVALPDPCCHSFPAPKGAHPRDFMQYSSPQPQGTPKSILLILE